MVLTHFLDLEVSCVFSSDGLSNDFGWVFHVVWYFPHFSPGKAHPLCPRGSGVQSITKGCKSLGYTGAAMDKLIGGNQHDLLSWAGFMHAVCLVLALRKGGLLWMGPPCGNFIWMSRSSTKRTISNPLGMGPKAEIANHLTSRWFCLAWLANAIGVLDTTV